MRITEAGDILAKIWKDISRVLLPTTLGNENMSNLVAKQMTSTQIGEAQNLPENVSTKTTKGF